MIRRQIYDILGSIAEEIEINDDTMLLDEGILDSIGILYLVSEIEEKNGIIIPIDEITEEHFKNVKAIDNYITQILGKAQ